MALRPRSRRRPSRRRRAHHDPLHNIRDSACRRDGRRLFGSDPGHSLDAASALSTPRDHSGRRQTIRCRAPMRAEARALLIDALRDAYCWQDELIRDSSRTIESIAAREKKTEHSIRMTLSLAFLSPALVKAAIEGRLSRGFGVKRLMDLPMSWSDQWSVLGLKAPAQT